MRNLILQVLTLALLIYPLSLSAQNNFSLSLDVDSAVGDQAVTSLNVSTDQVIAIQIFGKDIQNANGLAVRFEYDASQAVYEGFDTERQPHIEHIATIELDQFKMGVVFRQRDLGCVCAI